MGFCGAPVLMIEGARNCVLWGIAIPATGRYFGGVLKDKKASQYLASDVALALEMQGFGLQTLQAIACGIGPGSFTGLRITLAFAKGLAMAGDVPMIALPSLSAMLCEPEIKAHESYGIIALTNAFSGKIFTQGIKVDQGVSHPWFEVGSGYPEGLKAHWTESIPITLMTHQLPETLRAHIPPAVAIVDLAMREESQPPIGLLRLTAQALQAQRFENILTLTPFYGRESAAEENVKPATGMP